MPDQSVLCWRYDQWIESSIEALRHGDEILEPRTNQVIRFIDMEMGPSGDPILRACPVDSEKNCGIDLTGYSLTPYTYMVLDTLGIGLKVYRDDDTVQIRDDEIAPGMVFSPRLPRDELESFCRLHAGKYDRWMIEHGDLIFAGYRYPNFEKFWAQ